jgi:hypothetical protein
MKKIIIPGIVAGFALLILSVAGLYATVWIFPGIAAQYFDPAFDMQSSRVMIYYLHPFIIAMALSFFWARFKAVLTGSFITRGIEFGLIYALVAVFPMMWLIYGAMSVSIEMLATWFILAVLQGLIAGLIYEKLNP